jgi:hypothetical protein
VTWPEAFFYSVCVVTGAYLVLAYCRWIGRM